MNDSGEYYLDVNELPEGACIYSDADCKNQISWIHVMRISARSNARQIRHPVEDGGTIFDNKVIDPRTITVTCRILRQEYANLKKDEIFEKMLERRDYRFFSVRTKERQYKNLSLTTCSHTEVPDRYDVFDFDLTFTQVMFGKRAAKKTLSQDDSSTRAK